MKVLLSTAIWGESYCSTFARFSLATLLSRGNIPKLAEQATITCHIVTRRVDRERLLRDPAVIELQRYCEIEWELLEEYGLYRPPQGPGGEKYPFLSALQNIAIRRSVDHDVIIFNYADFIWADGSLTHAVEMLTGGRAPLDAVFSFCLPVDRDLAVRALEAHRQTDCPEVIKLAPRDGAKIAIECIHREAKIRFWEETPRFTNLPSYLIWRVGDQGLLIRAYHQSILAMRVRPDGPQYVRGILRGGLDSAFSAQLAGRTSLAFATDADKILVFSLYHTIVDSRVPVGVTREMSLRSLLTGEVTPEQRPFAERPIFLRLRDGDDALWKQVAEKSWTMLRQAQDSTPFDQAVYDKNYETHGVIPKISRLNFLNRRILPHLEPLIHGIGAGLAPLFAVPRPAFDRTRRIWFVLGQPPLLRAAIQRRLAWRISGRIWRVLRHPSLLRSAVERRLVRLTQTLTWLLERRRGVTVAPNVWVEPGTQACFANALAVEDAASKGVDDISALRKAEEMLRQTIKSVPVWIDPVQALGRNLWFQGRFDEAVQTWAVAEQLRDVSAWVAGWPVDSCVFLPGNCAQSIGLMGHIDAFVKYKILTADPRPYYLLAPPQEVVNDAFLEYWRDYITVVSQPEEIAKLARLEPVYAVNWNWAMPDGDRIVFVHEGIAAVQRAWQRAGRLPLLRLRQDHADALSQARAKWGMTEQDRFVCLHVRAFGFYRDAHDKAQEFRNTAIDSYYPLIRDLTDMGLWVTRMGDASMPPLDLAQCGTSGRVVDYAVSSEKSAELDVALCAQCELFVSSPSGLHTVAHAFGRPVCEVNYPIHSGFPWHLDEIFIPQLYFSQSKGRTLTLREILGSDLIHRNQQSLLERAGISLLPNEPDDIVETVREALSPSTYRVKDAALADRVCAAFDELNRQHNLSISGRLGRYFTIKYAAQLLPTEHHLQMPQ